jgi:TatD DNase family protein
MTYTDNHCHLYDPRLPGGARGAIEAARAAGVHRMITVGCDAATSAAAIAIAGEFDGVWATVGLHPHEARFGVDTIVGLFGQPKVMAVGECGLDYFYDHSPREVQQHAFAEQIQLARTLDLPLVIHTRDAWADTFAILDAEGVPETTIFHCFTGGPDEARSALDRQAYLSFSGIVTFGSAEPLRDAARLCPLDRMLVETDAPYLAPVPHRGKPNQPAYVPLVVEAIAAATQRDPAEVAAATDANACIAFRLPVP